MKLHRLELAIHLRATAARLGDGAMYRWTHQGRCNCGHLAQTLTGMTSANIHQAAVQSEGEWADHAAAYCETSGMPVDDLISAMLAFGITIDELGDLERLCSPTVLRWLPAERSYLDYRRREDVILYFETWAEVIEAEFALRQSPDAVRYINGKRFILRETPTEIPMGLDENPNGGQYAA